MCEGKCFDFSESDPPDKVGRICPPGVQLLFPSLHCDVVWCDVLSCGVLCCVVLCCVVLCCVVLCCVVLCCVVLCCAFTILLLSAADQQWNCWYTLRYVQTAVTCIWIYFHKSSDRQLPLSMVTIHRLLFFLLFWRSPYASIWSEFKRRESKSHVGGE